MIGLSLNVPLFNGFRAKNNVALEKINSKEQEIALQQLKLNLHQIIEQAFISMQTAKGRIAILENQVKAYEESFRINRVQFEKGVSNSTAYLVSKNNLDSARINLTNVNYTYTFRLKVLGYYQNGLDI